MGRHGQFFLDAMAFYMYCRHNLWAPIAAVNVKVLDRRRGKCLAAKEQGGVERGQAGHRGNAGRPETARCAVNVPNILQGMHFYV